MPGAVVAGVTLAVVLAFMAIEASRSVRNEGVLRAAGATEPPSDVYHTMRWAYPASFVAMAAEGALTGPPPPALFVAGILLFALSKALKIWAIRSLGERWTFRVLVLPDRALVVRGPYAFMRHPNYAAVLGEIVSVAITVSAPLTGFLAALGFGRLMQRRIAIEDQALRRS
jgi:methyltransferase